MSTWPIEMSVVDSVFNSVEGCALSSLLKLVTTNDIFHHFFLRFQCNNLQIFFQSHLRKVVLEFIRVLSFQIVYLRLRNFVLFFWDFNGDSSKKEEDLRKKWWKMVLRQLTPRNINPPPSWYPLRKLTSIIGIVIHNTTTDIILTVSWEIFTFLSHNNYRFSNTLLLFVQIKYLILCAIQLNNSYIINIALLDLLIHYSLVQDDFVK